MEKIKNIKIAVHNEEESRVVQEKLFELGAKWIRSEKEPICLDSMYLFVDNNLNIRQRVYNKKYFDNHSNKELYVDEVLVLEPEKEEFVDCPMEFEKIHSEKKILSLMFGDEQVIYYTDIYNKWFVSIAMLHNLVKTKIRKEPTLHEELEIGKWYCVNLEKKDIEDFELYLGDNMFKYVNNTNEIKNQGLDSFDDYHEVVVDE